VWLWLLAVLAALVVLAPAAPQAWAWYHYWAGRSALDRYHGDEARGHLEECLRVWRGSIECHVLAARAARRAGDLKGAVDHLKEAQRLCNGTTEEITLETALLHAAAGDLDECEGFLNDFARRHPDRAPLAWEALAQGYLHVYRVTDAMTVLKRWLDAKPDDVQAEAQLGDVYWQISLAPKAAEHYRRVVELDPERVECRKRLAVGLMDGGHYEEALQHLELARQRRPDDADLLVHLAACYARVGRKRQARETLDAVLANDPDNGPALRTHGLIAYDEGNAAEAEKWLREAVRVGPGDYQANLTLAQALGLEGKEAESQDQQARAQKVKDRNERLNEITTREMSAKPHDPALQAELGRLQLELGYPDQAKSWLDSAAQLNPRLRAAHEGLADYYHQRGDEKQEAEERQKAEACPPPPSPPSSNPAPNGS
jgi:tetratricopeptide (TPR) repeat protein